MADFKMPRMGDAMEEGVIVQWLKNVGDKVGPDDPIMEIETDKSNVEVPAETEGYIHSLLFKAGDSVQVGKTVATIGPEPPAAGASAAAPEASQAETAKVEDKPEVTKAEETKPLEASSGGPATAKNNGQASTPAPSPVTAPSAPSPSVPVTIKRTADFAPYAPHVGALPEGLGGSASLIGEPIEVESSGGASSERVKATPLARAMAVANNLDLAALRGSGPDGGIVKADIEKALSNVSTGPSAQQAPTAESASAPKPAASSVAVNASEGDEVQEYNAMRRTIAKRLVESKSTIPHFYVTAEIDVEDMMAFRDQVNASAGDKQPKVSFTDVLVKACTVAIQENPVTNSVFSDNKRIIRKAINIGIAVSIEDGLIVPVVKNCESKSIRAIARETRPLIEKARTGKLQPAEYTGGTFTISNLGQYDVENFAAIINPGEGAILAVSSVRDTPVVLDGKIVARKRMKVTLSADHRVMDGVAGAVFLQSLKRVIEDPIQILA